eukprot:1160389-Pelagomonas_calceolata.AAC.7
MASPFITYSSDTKKFQVNQDAGEENQEKSLKLTQAVSRRLLCLPSSSQRLCFTCTCSEDTIQAHRPRYAILPRFPGLQAMVNAACMQASTDPGSMHHLPAAPWTNNNTISHA